MATPRDLQQPKPFSKRLKGSLEKVIRKKTEEIFLEHVDGSHWRQSLNLVLLKSGSWSPNDKPSRSKRTENTEKLSNLLQLPRELRHFIEEFLSPSDAICLRQTCQQLRYESLDWVDVLSLNAMHLHSPRERFDRDSFSGLCSMETNGQLRHKLAACRFCLTLHSKKAFVVDHLTQPSSSRACSASRLRYLRKLLTDAIEAELHGKLTHYFKSDQPSESPYPTALSRTTESNALTPDYHSTAFIDDTSLVLEHHFHLQTDDINLPHGWNFAGALASPRRGITALCPHLTIHSAGIRLGRQDVVSDAYTACCSKKFCRTNFGWFQCPSESDDWKYLCFRVQRGFGLLENVASGL